MLSLKSGYYADGIVTYKDIIFVIAETVVINSNRMLKYNQKVLL